MNKYLEKIAQLELDKEAGLERSPLNLVNRLSQLQRATSRRMIGRAAGLTDKKFPVKAMGQATNLKNKLLGQVSDNIRL